MSKSKARTKVVTEKPAEDVEETPISQTTSHDNLQEYKPIENPKQEKSPTELKANQFQYDNNVFEIKAPKFILGNTEYSREQVLKSHKLQKQLTELVYYNKGKLRPLHKVKSSVLKVVF